MIKTDYLATARDLQALISPERADAANWSFDDAATLAAIISIAESLERIARHLDDDDDND